MGPAWRDCIVTHIDLPWVKRLATKTGAGSRLMRQLHALAVRQLASGFSTVAHAYAWNDSVLLLSYVDARAASYDAAMRDAEMFKRRVDRLRRSYAVSVKGRTFPELHSVDPGSTRVTVMKASSWAMANCFEIEKRLGKYRASWYVDGRIARKLSGTCRSRQHSVELLPSGHPRVVHSYPGYLWNAV